MILFRPTSLQEHLDSCQDNTVRQYIKALLALLRDGKHLLEDKTYKMSHSPRSPSSRRGGVPNGLILAVKIYFLLCLLIAADKFRFRVTNITVSAVEIGEVEHQYIFSPVGTIIFGLGYGHVYVPVKLEPLRNYMDQLYKIYRELAQGHLNNNQLRTSDVMSALISTIKMEIELVQHEYTLFETLLKADPKFQVRLPSEFRQKRQIMAALVGSLVGALGGSTLMGLFGGDDTDELREAILNNRQKLDTVVAMVKDNAAGITLNRQNIEKLKKAVTRIAKLVKGNMIHTRVNAAMIMSNSAYTNALYLINLYFDAHSAATCQHRLSPRLVNLQALSQTFADFVNTTNAKGYVTFFDDPRALFQMPTSFVPHDDGFDLLVHVPIGLPNSVFKIYKFVELPIVVSQVVILIRPPKTLLAVDERKQHFMELSSVDLQDCEAQHHIYLCDHLKVVKRRSKVDSCLMSLFLNEFPQALKTCEVHISKASDTAVNTMGNSFTTFTKQPGLTTVSCLNGTSYDFPVLAFDSFGVPSGCWADTPSLRLLSSAKGRSLTLPASTTYKWPVAKTQLLHNFTVPEVESVLQQLDTIGNPPTAVLQLKSHLEEYRRQRKNDEVLIPHHVGTWVSVGVFALGAVFLVIIGCLFWRSRSRKALPPGPHVEYHVAPPAPAPGPSAPPAYPPGSHK